jgi:hypothetical protein
MVVLRGLGERFAATSCTATIVADLSLDLGTAVF